MMMRKLLLPAIAVAVLGGCMTGGYSYRQDRGDYYYGEPRTEYRHYGSPYGYGGYGSYYGNGYYSRGYYPGYYPGYYHSPYGYPYGYYRPPLVIRPDGDYRPDHDDNDGKAPWRDYERLKRERIERSPVVQRRAMSIPARPAQPVGVPSPARSSNGGSRMETIIRRAKAGAGNRDREVEP